MAMHGVRRTVLEAQAAAAGLPLWNVPLPWPCSNEDYEQRMGEVCARAINENIDAIAFGDLFLEDVRAYREKQLRPPDSSRCFRCGGLRLRPSHTR